MNIGLNIGHYGTTGAVGYLDESKCAIEIYNKLKPLLEKAGHTVIPCNDATPKDYVSATKLANKHNLDLVISIHLNSFSDAKSNGTEVLYYKTNAKGKEYATALSKAISDALGTKNRGAVPKTNEIYIIKNTKATCVLLECLFVSNAEDSKKYNAEKIAVAVASYFGYKAELTGVNEIISELSKHIEIGDKKGLAEELNNNPSGRLYWICRKTANKLRSVYG